MQHRDESWPVKALPKCAQGYAGKHLPGIVPSSLAGLDSSPYQQETMASTGGAITALGITSS